MATKKLLDASAIRHEALAVNMANVETPGYKRVDLPKTFTQEFAAHLKSGQMANLEQPSIVQDISAKSSRADGNNVELDKELLNVSSNAMEYETLTEFVSGSLRQLKMAITGRSF